MSKFLYPIYKLKTKSYIKWWLYHKKAGGSGILSEILEGFSFNLANTLNRKFKLFDVEGNSEQESTKGYQLLSYLTKGTKSYGGINLKIDENGYLYITGSNTYTSYITLLSFTMIANQAYTIDETGCTNDLKISWANVNTFISDAHRTYTPTADTETAIQLIIPANTNYNNYKMKIFLYEGSYDSGKKLEPYTNGASPNPNYEQPILSSGDNGSINEKITNSDGTKEQDYSIFVQQPMRSIGDVRDGFVKVDGVWNEVHYIREKDLGECTWRPVNNDENSRTQGLFTSFSVQNIENYSTSTTTIPKLLSNKYISKPNYKYQDYGRNPQNYTISTYGGEILYIQNSDFSGYTNQQVKEALAGTVLQYVLKNPTYLPCTPEQIDVLENKPSTYKDFTIIQSEDETPAHLKIQYWKEVEQ